MNLLISKSGDNLLSQIKQLWAHFSHRRKVQFAALLVLMGFNVFTEIFRLGAVLSFLAVMTDPESLFKNPVMQPVLTLFNITSPEGMLLPLTLTLGVAAVMAATMRLVQAWANMRVSFATGAELSISVYRRTLYQPYSVHVSRNSSTIINAVSSKTVNVISGTVIPAVNAVISTVILLSIMATLIIVDPVIAFSTFVGFGVIYAVVVALTRKRLINNGILIARESDQLVKSLQEGLGGIRDVLIDGSQELYSNIYSRSVFPLRRAQGNNSFIRQCPGFVIEAIGMVLVAGLAYWLVGQSGGLATALPVLGTIVIGLQRMLPILQQLYGAWSSVQGNAAQVKDVLKLLEQPLPEQQNLEGNALPFENAIELQNVNFSYDADGPDVMRDISLAIPKGSKVGFIGATGGGKSTMLDIVMGLLEPTGGKLRVDGIVIDAQTRRSWQRNIAHVPQSIFLSDSSIEENIAFGVPVEKIDHERVRQAARQAQIDGVIESWPKHYKTFVGERGARLSGGQRQRIGIARALYKNADVIIFDEATSALDNETEVAVMRAIEALHGEITVLIIAHRLTTLRGCDMIVELTDGAIKATGTYEEIIATHNGTMQ